MSRPLSAQAQRWLESLRRDPRYWCIVPTNIGRALVRRGLAEEAADFHHGRVRRVFRALPQDEGEVEPCSTTSR